MVRINVTARILKPGGKLCILPLYLYETYAIQTDIYTLPLRGLAFEPDATLYVADDWRNRHGRFYDVSHFLERVVKHLSGLTVTIYFVTNEKAIDANCHLKFIAMFDKPA